MTTSILLWWSTTSTFQLSMLEGNLCTGFHVQGTNHQYTLYFSLAGARELEMFFSFLTLHIESPIASSSMKVGQILSCIIMDSVGAPNDQDSTITVINCSINHLHPCSSACLKELFPCSKVTSLHKTSSFSNKIWTFLHEYHTRFLACISFIWVKEVEFYN